MNVGRSAPVAVALLAMLAVTSCRATEPIPPVPDTALSALADSLCLARRQAATDPAAARATFLDRAHEDLHELARRLQGVDREAAGAVLLAKQKVEEDLATGRPSLAGDLEALSEVARAGLSRLAVETPPCNT